MRARGFTLLEVMVALLIVAIALPALLTALYRQADDTAYLRDKVLAQMVAANRLTEARLVVAATSSLQAGSDSGQSQFAERDWYWWLETQQTAMANFFRLEIRVAAAENQRERPLYTLVAFLTSDLQVDTSGPIQPGDGDPPDPGGSGDGDPGGGDTDPPDGADVRVPLVIPPGVESDAE